MPYKIKKQAGKFVVAKADTGKMVESSGHHMSAAGALAQMRAIIISEKRRGKHV